MTPATTGVVMLLTTTTAITASIPLASGYGGMLTPSTTFSGNRCCNYIREEVARQIQPIKERLEELERKEREREERRQREGKEGKEEEGTATTTAVVEAVPLFLFLTKTS